MSSIAGRSCLRVVGGLSMVGAGLVGVPAVGQPAAIPARTAWTEAQAVSLAATTGERVEVREKTSEYTRTFASPDGTLTAEASNTPVRVNRAGVWVAVDAALQVRPDGSVGAKAAYAEMRFSGGGPGPLATFTTEGGTFNLGSPWPLPKPVLAGTTATYAEVRPGLDLVIDASVEGFSYNLVVKTRPAAARLRSVRFPVSTNGLEIRDKIPGRPSYVDAKGRTMLTVGEALMWDSAGRSPGKSSDAVDSGPAASSRTAEVDLRGDVTGLTIEPDAAMLADAATVFPVVLDPTTMVGNRIRTAWAAAWQYYPDKSFYKTTHSLGVGFEDYEQHKIVRSFWQFDIAGFAGKKIVDAEFQVYSVHSANCTPKPVTVSRVSPISLATTWNNQPRWQADVASGTFAKGYSSSCPDGYYDFKVTSSLQSSATGHAATTTFRLRATDETDGIAWKQFNSSGLLTVKYISYPIAPYDLGSAADLGDPYQDCTSSSDPTILANKRPRFSARGRVGAGDNVARVKVQIQVVSPSGGYWTMTSGVDDAGELMELAMAYDLADNALYHFHARTLYPWDDGELVGPWSGNCYFKIDTTAPPPPTVTASYKGTPLANCLNTPSTCPKVAPFGEPVTFTISSSTTDVVALKYRFSGSTWHQVNGRSITLNLYPSVQGWNDMVAQAGDGAAHWSIAAYFRINIGPPSPPVASWKFDETSGTTAADSSGNGRTLSVNGATFDEAGRVAGSLMFDGTSDYATASTAPINTSQSFSVAAWVRLTSFEEGGVVGVPGAQGLGFQLYYSKGVNRWVFMQTVGDSATAGHARAESVEPPLYGVWTHLLGVYNASAKTVALYVNGRLQDTATFTHTPWRATGPIDVGRYRIGGNYGATFGGSIDNIQLWARAMPAAEVIGEANPRDASANGETVAALTAKWPFDGAYLATDQVWRTAEAVYLANMPVTGFADPANAFVEDDERGRVLQMSGAPAESVSLPRPVVDATGSFTVSVWAKLRDTSAAKVIVRQGDAWRLEFRPTGGNGAEWVFTRTTPTGAVSRATVITDLDIPTDGWTLLVGIYDAATNKIWLKVNEPRATDGGEAVFTSPSRIGATAVGSGVNGWLDELRVYAGVVSQKRMCTEIWGGTDCA